MAAGEAVAGSLGAADLRVGWGCLLSGQRGGGTVAAPTEDSIVSGARGGYRAGGARGIRRSMDARLTRTAGARAAAAR